MRQELAKPTLIITADDYGYRPSYDRGILAAARAGAVDAVSAMVERGSCDPGPLLSAGVEIGLHLELAEGSEEEAIADAVLAQLQRFEQVFGRGPSFLDGHHHCHARPGADAVVARLAAEHALPVRSTDARHRQLLRVGDVPTPDRTLGRLDPSESPLPPELERALTGDAAVPSGVTEWFVHPGYRDPDGVSTYDEAREEDLRVALDKQNGLRRLFRRQTHAAALTDGE